VCSSDLEAGYATWLRDGTEEGEDRWENLQELHSVAAHYDDFPPELRLTAFHEEVALVSDQDELIEDNDRATLLTLHTAKGLELPVVFIVGLEENILPHSRSQEDPDQMEEERRLMYVGVTRAKDRLYLIRSVQRGGRGMSEETIPSRYLDDLPTDLIQGRSRTGKTLRGRASSSTSWSLPPGSKTAPGTEARFRAGTRVQHGTWGEGIILNSRVQDGDELVDVVFESVGIKRLAASLANLKII
jgi:DNA helicase-2/ATP-dependent DNA helicase PcrA